MHRDLSPDLGPSANVHCVSLAFHVCCAPPQLINFVAVYFISPFLRLQLVHPPRFIFWLCFLLEKRLYIFGPGRMVPVNGDTPVLPRRFPRRFPPGPESEKDDCDYDDWDNDANRNFLTCDMAFRLGTRRGRKEAGWF